MSQDLYDLPVGWELKKLGDLTTLITKGTTPTTHGYRFEESGINFIKIESIVGGEINHKTINSFISQEAHRFLNRSQLQKGDLLFSIAGSIGTAALVEENILPANTNQALAIIRGYDDYLHSKFLLYALRSELLASTRAKSRGGALQNISLGDIKDAYIPLPPLAEQARIVEKLDAVLSRIDTAIDELQQSLKLVDAMFKSGLDGVFEEVFVRSEVKKLSELTTKIGSGSTPKGGERAYKETGISLIRSLNVHDINFKYDGLAFIDDEQAKALSNVEVAIGDVLLNITGASIARCCIVPDALLPARVNQHVCILRPNHLLNSEFLNYLIVSPKFKSALLFQGAGGATRQALTKAMIENFDIPVPTLEKQVEAIQRITQLNQQTTQLKTEITAKIDLFNQLKASVLDGAFRGEL